MKRPTLQKITFIISIGLFLISLTQDCYCTTNDCISSLAALIVGGLGFSLSPAGFSWLANLALFISWISVKKNFKASIISSLIAAVFAVSFLFFHDIVSDEAGNSYVIVSYKLGYGLWLSSTCVMLIGNFCRLILNRNTVNE